MGQINQLDTPFKVIVAGSRTFNDYELLKSKLDIILSNKRNIEIVSGKSKGADELGERYARDVGHSIVEFPADWTNMEQPCLIRRRKDGSEYNAIAGHKRNRQMAEYADALIAFWSNKSSGTANMIKIAKELNLLIRVINV